MEYRNLLKTWTDTLIAFQIKENSHPAFHGGIMCPACQRIHGRIGDCLPAFFETARLTGDDKYIEAARQVFYWSERNAARQNGAIINDANSLWTGITAFSLIALVETLNHHEPVIPGQMKTDMVSRIRMSADYLFDLMPVLAKANVNYIFGFATAFELSGKYLNNEEYCRTGRQLMNRALTYLDEDGLIFGEGHPDGGRGAQGGRAIDIGYNVEESIPLMVQYYMSTKDPQVKTAAVKAMKAHLAFLLPDGGWDNSFGTRNGKWTYWGSRTSDGCQTAYSYFQDEFPQFGQAAYLNYKLLEQCTHEGFLSGGPMYHEAGELPCIHHTFCHAKMLAFLSALEIPLIKPAGPALSAAGIRSFSGRRLYTVATPFWRATVSGADYQYAAESSPAGGALSLLWHRDAGPVLAATMTRYHLYEALNLQVPKNYPVHCCTMSISSCDGEIELSSLHDLNTVLKAKEAAGTYQITARGNLSSPDAKTPLTYDLTYIFEENKITIRAAAAAAQGVLHLPVIAGRHEFTLRKDESSIQINKAKAKLLISSSHPLSIGESTEETDGFARIFNPTGGFLYLPVSIQMTDKQAVQVSIETDWAGR